MKKPTTIAEATAMCIRCDAGKLHPHGDPSALVQCHYGCNGTGYACGVAPTEVELHMFAIVTSVKALWRINARAGASSLPLLKAALSGDLDKLNDIALSGRTND